MRRTCKLVGQMLLVLALPALVWAGSTSTKKKYAEVDKGPKTIDVSKYPKDMQGIYKNLFLKKCSKCHTVARPINTSKTDKEWTEYIQKMRKKPNSGVDAKSAELITKFVIYDQHQRKDKAAKNKK